MSITRSITDSITHLLGDVLAVNPPRCITELHNQHHGGITRITRREHHADVPPVRGASVNPPPAEDLR
jgi:hypothetical protein